MKVAIIGAAGKAGSKIAVQALSRGHEITAIVHAASASRVPAGCAIVEKDLFELSKKDLEGFDAVIDAFGSHGPGTEEEHITSLRHLTSIMKELPDTRLLVVGGAGSLYGDEYGISLVMDTIPEAFRGVPTAMKAAFEELKQSGINWTYFSPAAKFDPNGRRTGKYILGNDYIIPNSLGESYISYEDYALAMVDELDNKLFIGKRFTAVSDTSSVEREKSYNLFDLSTGSGFTRRGSYFGIYSRSAGMSRGGMTYASGALSIISRRGAIAAERKESLFLRLVPTFKGHNIPYAIRSTATELTLVSLYGKIRCCFPKPNMLYIKGEGGLGLKLEREMNQHQIIKKRGEKAYDETILYLGDLIINPLKGDLDMHSEYEWETLGSPQVRGVAEPDENGEFLISFEENPFAGIVQDSYPTYEEGLADVKADWESFLANIPHFDRQLEEYREEAAWNLWSYLVDASGKIRRPMIYMTGTGIASSWQMAQNAVALNKDLALATELLLNQLDEASPTGQLPDFYDDMVGINMMIKPPLQGWALKWIMKSHDLGKEIPRDKLEKMYNGYVRWADWFFKYRDDDHDGVPQYEHGDETGYDDCDVFQLTPIMETPDLTAYLVLLYEALGDIAAILGNGKSEEHYAKSRELTDLLIKTFWNGERFVAYTNGDHREVATDCLLYYQPIILGKRLPQEIIDKLAADLSVEGEFLTGYGLASERLGSDNFRAVGMAKGSVLAPTNLLILTGLYDAGKVELAKKIALRYCETLKRGFNLMINPLVGNMGGFGCSWPACAYIVLADMYSNM